MATTEKIKKESIATDTSPSRSATSSKPSCRSSSPVWTHVPSNVTLRWLLFSIPLVIWDTGFVLLRPLSMPGGALQWPLWVPYEIYIRTDFIYGWKALDQRNGFTAAQGFMNIPESLLYAYYLYIVYTQTKAPGGGTKGSLFSRGYVGGQAGITAVIVAFVAAVMTFSKTVLYVLNEAFSGWSNVGHNDWINLISFWIIPNGAWLVASGCMSIQFGREIWRAMLLAAGAPLTAGKRE